MKTVMYAFINTPKYHDFDPHVREFNSQCTLTANKTSQNCINSIFTRITLARNVFASFKIHKSTRDDPLKNIQSLEFCTKIV